MEIEIFRDIDDPELVRGWKRLENEHNYFPQSRYDWCAPWWKSLGGNRQLYIVAVIDNKQKIAGIAPCCIERRFGLALLRSFPIHFGDFFTFIIDKDRSYSKIAESIIIYLQTFKHWNAIKFDQMNSKDLLFPLLLKAGFLKKKMSDIYIAEFEGKNTDEFMQTLSKSSRKGIMLKVRRLFRDFSVEFIEVRDFATYIEYFSDLKAIYFRRWGKQKSEKLYQCRNVALSGLFPEDLVRLYILKINGMPIGYKLGFKHDSCFYSWQLAHDPKYNKYSPGFMITYLIISNADIYHISKLNFMAGGHNYDQKWAKSGRVTENYTMIYTSNSLMGRVIEKYFLEWREKLKSIYHKMKLPDDLQKLVGRSQFRHGNIS